MAGKVTIRELVTKWGFDVDSKPLKVVEKRTQEVKQVVAAVGTVAAASAAALFGLSKRTAEYARNVLRQSNALDVSTDKFQELEFLFKRFGADGDDVSDAIATVTDRAEDAAGGMESMADDFKLIGVGVDQLRGKKPGELFDLFVEGMAKTEDPAKRVAAGARILGDDLNRKLAPALAAGGDELDRIRALAHESGAIMSGDALEAAAEFAETMDDLKAFAQGFGRSVASDVLPQVTALAKAVLAWVRANREAIDTNLKDAAELAADGLKMLWEFATAAFDAVDWLVESLGGLNRIAKITGVILATFITFKMITGVWAFTGVIMGLVKAYRTLGATALIAQAKALLIPAAIAALIVLVGLVIEDFQKFFDGQDSAIGELVKKYPGLGDVIFGLKDAWDQVSNAFGNFFDQAPGALENFQEWVFDSLFKVVDAWENLKANVNKVWDDIVDEGQDKILELIQWVNEKFGGLLGKAIEGAEFFGLGDRTGDLRALQEGLQLSTELATGGGGGPNTTADARGTQARQGGARVNASFQGGPISVYQQPGEDGQALAERVASEQQKEFDRRNREAADSFEPLVIY